MRRLRLVTLILTISLPLYLICIFLQEWSVVDSCLDSGGSFDYSTMTCDHKNNHPYIPFGQRHREMLWLVSIGCLSSLIIFFWSFRARIQPARDGISP